MVVKETLVICDGCGDNGSGGDDRELTATEIRKRRKIYGWTQARELLANAAHGPLELIRYEHGGGRLYREEPRDLIADFYDVPNRELYYRAPELLNALADEVERLREELDDAHLPRHRDELP